MKPAHIIAIVASIVGAGVGLYFLLRNRLPSLLTADEEESQQLLLLQEESLEEPTLSSPAPQKLALKSLTPNVVYQNRKDVQLIRDSEGRIERFIIDTKVVDNRYG